MRKLGHSGNAIVASSLAIAVAAFAAPAFAQSTGSVEFEKVIIVTGTRAKTIAGVDIPDTPKAKQVLDQKIIGAQTPGQSINDVINLVPGVSSQNNDPFGSAGGKLYIRGFDNTRISETFDGLPLNDTGGYSLFSNQQLDPELIEQVNVNLGSTDVDSPTASASGSTVNYRSRKPSEDFAVRVLGSAGDFSFLRVFGVIDTGKLNASGTRAFFAASKATNDTIYGGIGKINKTQFNAKIYQPLGDNGDFISIAGHYNRNRNNFFGSVPMWNENIGARVVGGASSNRLPLNADEQFYVVNACSIPAGVAGTADAASSCGTAFEYRYNPSNTGNIRINSKFTLSDRLVLTIDPSYQYTKANGGGTVTGREQACNLTTTGTCGTASATTKLAYGFIGGSYFFGTDLNKDGDKLDQVTLLAPSHTQTHRIGVIASLRFEIDTNNTVRVNYSYDRGRHRQTGEVGYLSSNGFGASPFPVDAPILDVNGNIVEKRNRLSYAILQQVSGEYRGRFLDNKLTFNLGLRAPFFKRNLTNYCFATNAGGNVNCFEDAASSAAYATAVGYSFNATTNTVTGAATPQQRIFNYSKILPSAGLTFAATPQASLFLNYSKGLQVPGTDNLYNAFFFPLGTPQATPTPETTDNFDLGIRFRQGKVLAQLSGWYTVFSNRLASAFDRDLNTSIYRNLGRVDKYGIDASLSFAPMDNVNVYLFGSYLKSKIKNNVDAGTCSATQAALNLLGCTVTGGVATFQTAGKRESGAPIYTLGARLTGTIGPVDLGLQAKRTGPRYVNDQNLPFNIATTTGGNVLNEIFPAKSPAYTLVDLDARVHLPSIGLKEKSYLQVNVTNVFNTQYVGGFDGTLISTNTAATLAAGSSPTFAQIGTPRTFIVSLNLAY